MTTATLTGLAQRIAVSESHHLNSVQNASGAPSSSDLDSAIAEIRQAMGHADTLSASLRRGDPKAKEADLDLAYRRIDRIGRKIEDIETRLKESHSGQADLQTDGAFGLVSLVRRALPGVPVHVCVGPVPDLTKADVPAVVLRQVTATTTGDGTLADGTLVPGRRYRKRPPGVDVELTYAYNSSQPGLEHQVFVQAAERLGVDVDLNALQSAVEVEEVSEALHIARVVLRTAEPAPVPVVEDDDHATSASALDTFSREVGINLAARAGLDHLDTYPIVDRVRMTVRGYRTTRIEASTAFTSPEGDTSEPEDPVKPLEHFIGTFVSTLGRVESIEELSSTPDRQFWSVVFTSRPRHDLKHPVILT